MKGPLENTSRDLIERFGRSLAENFLEALEQINRSLGNSDIPAHKELREFLAPMKRSEREIKIAQAALESFIHEFLASLDESDDFKIVGTLEDGSQFDLRDLCPEGLHGSQLDWIEEFTNHKSTYEKISENDFSGKT